MAKTSTKKQPSVKKLTATTKVSKILEVPKVARLPKLPKGSSEELTDDGKRSFKVIYKTLSGEVIKSGRYCGKKPKQAACKALTAVLKLHKRSSGKTYTKKIFFGVVETTRGSRHKYYWYSGERQKVTTVEVTLKERKDSPIVYRYNNIVMKASEEDCRDLLPEDDTRSSRNKHLRPSGGKKTTTHKVEAVEKSAKSTKKSGSAKATTKEVETKPAKAAKSKVVPTPAPVTATKKAPKKGVKKSGK